MASPCSATTISIRMGLLLLICVNSQRHCLEVSSPHDGPPASFLVQCFLVLASRPKEIFGGHRETLKFLQQSVSRWPFLRAPNYSFFFSHATLETSSVTVTVSSAHLLPLLLMTNAIWLLIQKPGVYRVHACVHVCAHMHCEDPPVCP